MKAFSSFCLFLTLSANYCAAATCYPESAVYEMRGSDAYTAGFRKIKSAMGDLAFFVSSKTTGRSYWFQMDMGNGYTDTYLLPIAEPQRGMQPVPTHGASKVPPISFFSLNKKLDIKSEVLVSSNESPEYIFLPQLGADLYYFNSALTDSEVEGKRELLPRGLWELKACTSKN
ncbi:hypothetical protein [Duganella levis]|uniref:Uncharacterized protein n=1 Tax=Duganella levis TaxID=2692169 RepID=A0ABW9W804_9BURK|nr:hypothetical protein [Duganella levis]MYN30108.1 hypothetical protein [Duganella levis]